MILKSQTEFLEVRKCPKWIIKKKKHFDGLAADKEKIIFGDIAEETIQNEI